MVNLDYYFEAWKLRLEALRGSLYKIKALPKDAQLTQAFIVRNSCIAFVAELETAFGLIAADYIRRQDVLFEAEVDRIQLAAYNKKPWPLDVDLPARLLQQKKTLTADCVRLAQQVIALEASIARVQEVYVKKAHEIIGELTMMYGVSLRIPKKKKR